MCQGGFHHRTDRVLGIVILFVCRDTEARGGGPFTVFSHYRHWAGALTADDMLGDKRSGSRPSVGFIVSSA
jgi:hypothetical protein